MIRKIRKIAFVPGVFFPDYGGAQIQCHNIANKLTDDQMYELEQSNSGGTFDQLVSTTNQRFEAMCQ